MTRLGAAAFALVAAAGCALPPDDVHLAPLYSYHRLAAGGWSHEALGGIFEVRGEETPGADPAREVAVRPLFRTRAQGDRRETDVLWPFGRFTSDADESTQRFFPLWFWKRRPNELGQIETDWMIFPLVFGGSGEARDRYFAVFPFGGTLRDFFTYERVTFVLFPIYGETVKQPNNARGYAILFPFSGWGGDDSGMTWWRAWPFFARSSRPGVYDRTMAAWPFWHYERNFQDTANPSTDWIVFPFYGEVDQGAMHGRTLLWPFFGWDWNDETGYSTWEAPWPLVRVTRNGSGVGRPYSETRFLPFYASYRGYEIDSTNYLWPIVWVREEAAGGLRRSSLYVVPFFYTSRGARDLSREEAASRGVRAAGESTDLVWPFYRQETNADGSATAEALWPMPWPWVLGFRENWFPFFSIFSSITSPNGATSDRALLDLFRRESSDQETRW
ncbi:MAG TPA: hypothetical protein VKE69_12180, partial [Planctomycetota bacterium]|nr:hypothetical protein [Planctomycetota bacterium]